MDLRGSRVTHREITSPLTTRKTTYFHLYNVRTLRFHSIRCLILLSFKRYLNILFYLSLNFNILVSYSTVYIGTVSNLFQYIQNIYHNENITVKNLVPHYYFILSAEGLIGNRTRLYYKYVLSRLKFVKGKYTY